MVHAASTGHLVAFYSLEMSVHPVVMRLLASRSSVPTQRMRTGKLGASDWTSLTQAASDLASVPWIIVDRPGMTLQEIRAHARKTRPAMVVLDYLQLVEIPSSRESRNLEVAKVSKGLKNLARELRIPVIALAQLNRGAEDRPEHEPELADLRESGAIEQDADVVALIHRPDHYRKAHEKDGKAELKIPKNRNGPTGRVRLTWDENTTTFRNYGGEE